MTTAAEMLADVNTAIRSCLTAQSYTVAGRQKAMAQLGELRKFRQELIDEIANGSQGSMCSLLSLEDVRE